MASIDASLKDDIKRLFRKLNRQGLTIIHVTHDYREAVSLATRVGVIHNGRIIQEGTPDEVFRKPVNKFVARYSGIRNFFRVEFKMENNSWKAVSGNKMVFNLAESTGTGEGLLLLRGDDIKIYGQHPSAHSENCFRGVVKDIFPSEFGMEITVDAGEHFLCRYLFRYLQAAAFNRIIRGVDHISSGSSHRITRNYLIQKEKEKGRRGEEEIKCQPQSGDISVEKRFKTIQRRCRIMIR